MKVLLIHPNISSESIVYLDTEPIALEYIAAGIKGLCEVRLHNLMIDKNLWETLDKYRPDIIGLTGYTIHVNIIKNIVDGIKNLYPSIKIVIGGHHATVAPHDFYDIGADYIVIGEGVFIFKDIVEVMMNKKTMQDLENVEIKQIGSTMVLRQMKFIKWSELPIPDRSINNHYREKYKDYKWMSAIRSSAGCKFHCKFCGIWSKYQEYSSREPSQVLEEIKGIEEDTLIFTDDEAFLEPERMMRIADLLIENNIKKAYYMLARVDTILKNKELFIKWRQAGLRMVFVGIESITDEGLKDFNKGTSISMITEVIGFLSENGIDIVTAFIINPSFTKQDFRNLKKFVRKFKLHKKSNFSIFTPLPGTDLYKELEPQLIDKKFEHFDTHHCILPTTMPLWKFYREYYNLINPAYKAYFRRLLMKKGFMRG